MQRLGCLALVITAACGGGSATGPASLTNVQPPVKAAAAETFSGPDASGTNVLGWTILLYENEPGGDCLEGTVAAKISIFTNQAEGSQPQALLNTGDSIVISTQSPPMVAGSAAANMGVEGVTIMSGSIQITDFHRTADNMHADLIEGNITAGGLGPNDEAVSLTGMFSAPICTEE